MNKIEKVNQLHERAMLLAEDAFLAKRAKNQAEAMDLYQQPFTLEKEAAMLLVNDYDIEPTRSVLFKGAASLALNCENFREVERMTGFALSGNPPAPITQELRELLDIARVSTRTISPIEKFQQLPQNLQEEVAHFIDFLMVRHGTSVEH
jgi:hypothetical protein